MAISRLGNGFTILAFLGFSACSAAPVSTGVANHGAGGTGNNGGAGSGAVANSYSVSTGGSALTAVDGGRPPRCDDAGNCVCMNIAEIGTAGQFGSNPGQDGDVAFQSWMNDPANSNAHVDLFKTKPTLKSNISRRLRRTGIPIAIR